MGLDFRVRGCRDWGFHLRVSGLRFSLNSLLYKGICRGGGGKRSLTQSQH